MGYADLHMHTCFCDGKNTPEEMALSAIEKGLESAGICTHSYLPFGEDYCIPKGKYPEFRTEVARLKEKYNSTIRILCGIEQDLLSRESTEGFDYVIGSVHHLTVSGEYFSVDDSPESFAANCRKHFGGDYLAFTERYYESVARVAEITKCDIIGHFDLIAKFNEGQRFFDESDPRYVFAWQRAADALLPYGKPFEVNTGAISRGWRTEPYPSAEMCTYLLSHGAKLILNSDAHSAETVAFRFEKWESRTHL